MADKLGGEANVAAAQNLSKEALDEDMYKALLNDDKTYTLPNVGNEKVQKGINYVNEKILAPAQKATRDIINPDWRDGNGRKPKQDIVKEWRKNNPTGKPKECITDTGLNKNTVYKWWNRII